jgi:NAD(P)-dependent dehydrogenase (short-subunit alcohol dehydrogenase family)
MTTPQHKIGSGFGATSTADEVLAGLDLSGKLAIVTGGYSGIGLETTRALTRAGAHVVVPARRPTVAAEALAGLENTEIDQLDLADLESVRAFAERFVATGRRIDMFIGNAGIMVDETRVGPGWEAMFATNHLGHFALVNRLRPAFAPAARVVMVSSVGHRHSGIRWDDPHFEHRFERWRAYGQSKTANVLFAVQLDKLAQDRGIRAFALHPGLIDTDLVQRLPRRELIERGMMNEAGEFVLPVKSTEQGAATQVWAATSPQLAGMGGVYLENCDIAELAQGDGARSGVRDYAIDPGQAARLWTLSAELTGVNAFG